MKRKISTFTFALLLALPFPVTGMAADHGGHEASSHNGAHDSGMHSDMEMGGAAVFSETVTVEGVKATAQLLDTKEAMAKAGMEATNHLMINFTNEQDGTAIESGMAAVKVTPPSGEEQEAQKMMGMAGGFGVDLSLKQAGPYTFTVGTKLADGQKRQLVFHGEVK